MRVFPALLSWLLFVPPAAAHAQSFGVQASAGPTLVDPGYSVAAGVGLYPASRVAILLNFERTHQPTEVRSDGRGGETATRRGTLILGTGELQVSLFPRDRVGPYGLIGFAAGRSRLNVNERFPTPVSNDVRAISFGGGVQVPIGERVSLFGDTRLTIGEEANELLGIWPLRAGLAWRF